MIKMSRMGNDIMLERNDFVIICRQIIKAFFIADFQISLLVRIRKFEEVVQKHVLSCYRTEVIRHTFGKEESFLFREDYECAHRHIFQKAVSLRQKLRIKTDRRVI